MNARQIQLIKDNPNLSNSALARFLCVSRDTVRRTREKPKWKHRGVGIPYTNIVDNCDGLYYRVEFNRRVISNGSFELAMLNLDRLIFCLEHNDGKLPLTAKQSIYQGLRFIKE